MGWTNPDEGDRYTNTMLELLDDIRALLGGSSAGATQVPSTTVEIDGTHPAAYTDKRALWIERTAAATGSIIVNGITYAADDPVPWWPDMGAGWKHIDIDIDATGASGVRVHYFDTP